MGFARLGGATSLANLDISYSEYVDYQIFHFIAVASLLTCRPFTRRAARSP
jgi:hypothetical protein